VRRAWTVLVVVMALVVAGCGGSDDEDSDGGLAGNIAEEVAEQIAEESGDDVDIEIDDDELTVSFDDESGSGEVTFGGGELPDGFPFPVPDEYEVGSSMVFEQGSGDMFSVTLSAPDTDFDEIAAMYEVFLEDEGFEVNRNLMEGDAGKILFLDGTRSDATALISMSVQEVGNDDAGNLFHETVISLSWTPGA
jgi:hypothetical protein